MSIQRYTIVAVDGMVGPDDNGLWISYADHVEALRQAEQALLAAEVAWRDNAAEQYEQGQRDERKRSVLLIADAYGKGHRDALAGAIEAATNWTVDDAYDATGSCDIDEWREAAEFIANRLRALGPGGAA
jgi:hypothetical protein